MPLKPTKRGFKVWVVAESMTGYFLDLQVYVGKETEVTEHGLGERSGPSADRAVSQEKLYTRFFGQLSPPLVSSESYMSTGSMRVRQSGRPDATSPQTCGI